MVSDREQVLVDPHPPGDGVDGPQTALVPVDPPTPPAARGMSWRRAPGRPRSAWTVVLPLAAAVVLGTAAGVAPAPVGGAVVAGAVVAGLLLRLEWAALAVVGASVFEDYLAQADPRISKVLALVLLVSWLIRRCSPRGRPPTRSPVLLAALAFTAVIAASTLLHNNGDAGQHVVVRYAGFLVVLLVLADALRDGLTPQRLARAYVAACAAAALCGIATFAVGGDRRVGGPIGDPNDLAFFLIPAVALGPAVRGGRHPRLWDLATVVVVVGIAGTLSRGALVGLVVMLLVVLVTGMVRARVVVGLVAAVVTAVLLVVVTLPGLVSVSLQQKGVVADQNVSERLGLWRAAAQMTVEHPVLGLGPGAFSLEHDEFTTNLPDDVNHPLDVAHNTWLEVSSELGLVGLAAFVAVLVLAFAGAWRAWKQRGDPVGAAVCAGLVGTAVAATFVTEQYYLPFWLLAALAVGVSSPPKAGGPRP